MKRKKRVPEQPWLPGLAPEGTAAPIPAAKANGGSGTMEREAMLKSLRSLKATPFDILLRGLKRGPSLVG